MAIQCEFLSVIIPITNVDRVYPGGFDRYKEHREGGSVRAVHDEHLVWTGFMSPGDAESEVRRWRRMGFGTCQRQWDTLRD